MTSLVLALLLAAGTPLSHLGVDVVADDSAGSARALLAACPAVARFEVDRFVVGGMNPLVDLYRQTCPGGQVIFQVGGTGLVSTDTDDPATLWSSSWRGQLPSNAKAGDWVEGPNSPLGSDPTRAAQFWVTFANQVSASSYSPIVGGLPAGPRPTVTTSTGTEDFFCATLRALPASGWAWSIAALSTTLSTSATTEQSGALLYRQVRSSCGIGGRVLLAPAGRASGSWSSTDLTWLAWFDQQIAPDSVLGAALFEAGGTDRSLSPIANQLAAYLQNPSTPDGGTDGGSDGGQDGGGGGATIPGGPGAPGTLGSPPPSSSCATAGAGVAALLALAPLALRRRRQGVKR